MTISAAQHETQFYGRYIGATILVLVDGTSRVSSALVQGARYALLCPESAVYVRQGGAGLLVTAGDFMLPQGQILELNSDDVGSNRFAVTTASGTGGNLRITRIDSPLGITGSHESQFFTRFLGPTIHLAINSGAAVLSAALVHGARYGLLCVDDDVWLRQGGTGLAAPVASDTEFMLPRGELFEINVDDANTDLLSARCVNNDDGDLQILRMDSP